MASTSELIFTMAVMDCMKQHIGGLGRLGKFEIKIDKPNGLSVSTYMISEASS